MFNGNQGYSISEIQMVGNCIEVCTTIKKKREWERIEREREGGWDIRKEKLMDKKYLMPINQLQLETLFQFLFEQT